MMKSTQGRDVIDEDISFGADDTQFYRRRAQWHSVLGTCDIKLGRILTRS